MSVFYNEWDAYPAQWLRNLISAGELPNGYVSEKSITELTVKDLNGYDQCHFFAGIGGWPLALRWAGLESVLGIWTGSPPCQPFSNAGKKLGINDERHLAPIWAGLIREAKPSIIFGEQVASAIAYGWVDKLSHMLENENYAFGFAILQGSIVEAPHERSRIFFGAVKMDNASKMYGKWHNNKLLRQQKRPKQEVRTVGSSNPSILFNPWKNNEVVTSEYDGKNRICKPGIPLLVNGIPGAMGGISGYGNAIIPQVAVFFIEQFMESIGDMLNA